MVRKIEFGIKGMDEFDYREKTVLLRLDINSTIHRDTKKIISENRINMSIPTVKYILDQKIISNEVNIDEFVNTKFLEEAGVTK